jgi:hypothetical protein
MQLFVYSVYITKTGPRHGIRTLFNILIVHFCFNLAIILILFVLASDNLIGTFILYCKIQECRLTVETTKWRQASSMVCVASPLSTQH